MTSSYGLTALKSCPAEVQASVAELDDTAHPSIAIVAPVENCSDVIIACRSRIAGYRFTCIGEEDGFGEPLSGSKVPKQITRVPIPGADCGFIIRYGCPEPKFLSEFAHRIGRRDSRVHRMIMKEEKVFFRGHLDQNVLTRILTALMGDARGFIPEYFGWDSLQEESMQAISTSRRSMMFENYEPWHVLLELRPVLVNVPETKREPYKKMMEGVHKVLKDGYVQIPPSLRSADYRNPLSKSLW